MNTSNYYSYARDGFIYILSYVTLLIFSLSLNFLLKAITNKYLIDTVVIDRFADGDSSIIGFLAALIIAFPIFMYLNVLANKMLGNGKMRPNTGVRNWLIYLTLVIVILIIIWQIIGIFIAFLEGTLVLRSIIHILITLIISFSILAYQYWHLKFFNNQDSKITSTFKILEWLTVLIIITSIIFGFFIIDSPSVRKVKRLDQTRVERLSNINRAIYNFYDPGKNTSGHQKLPKDLNELINDIRIFIPLDGLLDPDTKEKFEYNITGSKTYQLCATFDTDFNETTKNTTSPELLPEQGKESTTFYHPIGRYCFDLSI